MTDRVFEYTHKVKIPLWKWVLLHFVKTYSNTDENGIITSVFYFKKLFGELYVWKEEMYKNGVLFKSSKMKRITEFV